MSITRIIYRAGVKLATRLGLYGRRRLEYLRLIFKVLSILSTHRGKPRVALDLGCANGWLTRRIAKHLGLAVGIDISFHSEWVESRNPSLEFIVADARSLPLRPDTADCVVAISLLEHVPGWNRVVSEVHRVLRHGGLFIIQLPNLMYFIEPHTKFPLLGLLPKRVKAILASSVGYRDLQFSCTLKNVVKELRRHGFEYWVSHYHHTPHKLMRSPPSYFVVALKGKDLETVKT